MLFSTLTMNTQALHLDAAFAGDAAVRAAAHELDVDALDDGRRIGGAADAGHARRAARVHRDRRSRRRCSPATRSTTETEVVDEAAVGVATAGRAS